VIADRSPPVLQLDQVWLPRHDQDAGGIAVDLALESGDLVLIEPGDDQHERALADVACGLLAPARGAVRFLGRAWPELPADQANALRGRIGRLVRRGAWLPYLSLLDNILLAQLHHTRRPYSELCAEAARWAAWFGLPGVPMGRPDETAPAVLLRAACIRTFLGRPLLIVIESAGDELRNGLIAPLVNAMRTARDRGAGVLWFCRDHDLLEDPTLPATRRLRFRGDTLVPLEGLG
jgi:phospholipid/cholesterol/gamma-HCH transport system ATP-binding protein